MDKNDFSTDEVTHLWVNSRIKRATMLIFTQVRELYWQKGMNWMPLKAAKLPLYDVKHIPELNGQPVWHGVRGQSVP